MRACTCICHLPEKIEKKIENFVRRWPGQALMALIVLTIPRAIQDGQIPVNR